MSKRYPIVVQGEASETDSDDEVYITSLPPSLQNAAEGAKVPGEASETDSEGELERADNVRRNVIAAAASHEHAPVLRRDLPPLIVVRDHPDIPSVVGERLSPAHRPYGETLLQQKLQESNCRLCTDMGQMLRQVYGSASREELAGQRFSTAGTNPVGTVSRYSGLLRSTYSEVRGATTQLNSSQGAIINASHSIRLILDDLKAVSEKIDIITSCHLLPDINIATVNVA